MKKVLFNSFLLVACLAVFSSCAKEETFDKTYTPIQNEVETDKVIPTQSDSDYDYDDHDGRCGG